MSVSLFLFCELFVLFFIYLPLAVLGLHGFAQVSLTVASWATLYCGVRAAPFGGFSCYRPQALGVQASVVAAHTLSYCGSEALKLGLSSCGTWA